MADPYFRRLSGDDGAGRYAAGEPTIGPWSRAAQHGGPPNALAVLLADRAVRAAGRTDLVALRVASDFVGAVPVGEFDATVEVVRLARTAAVCSVQLAAGGRVCLSSRIWFVHVGDTTLVATAAVPVDPPPPAASPGNAWDFGYARSLDWRFVSGAPPQLGPAVVWARPRHPLLADGEVLPGLARVALVADSASGVSAELDWAHWSFANVDLDLHLARPFAGEWVRLEAVTTVGPAGSALCRSTIADLDGEVGSGLQTLVVAPTG